MEETKMPAPKPIDDVKSPLLDASSTGAEFSEDSSIHTQTKPSTDISSTQLSPPATTTTPTESAEPSKATEDKTPPIEQAQESHVASAPVTDATSKDNGTHRTKLKTQSSGKGLAVFIVVVGIMLCGFVIFVYLSTNN